MTVKVVTDSCSDLPREVAEKHGITVVPLSIHFATEVYRDGVDLSAEEFYQRLVSSPQLPTTSQPSVGAFVNIYESLSQEADGILSIHISSKISGTYNSAIQAKKESKVSCPIEVIDSTQASMGLGFIALAAGRAVQEGAGLEEAVKVTNEAIPRCQFYGLLDTLHYLEKGGRIGKAQAFLGFLLKIKPLLKIQEGEAHPIERVRTFSRGVDRLCQITEGHAPLEDLCVLHSTTPDEAQALAQRLSHLSPQSQVIISRFGPVIGTHLGPGALGISLRSRANP